MTFDPQQISLGKIPRIYFSVAHNPTELELSGSDPAPNIGRRSSTPMMSRSRLYAYTAQLDKTKLFGDPIVTKLEPLTGFHPAEDYHQDFAGTHPELSVHVSTIPRKWTTSLLFLTFTARCHYRIGLQQAQSRACFSGFFPRFIQQTGASPRPFFTLHQKPPRTINGARP